MQSENYKETLRDALENLVKVNESIFDSMVTIALQGELKEWNNAVSIGEVHQFDYQIFKNSEDTNIRLLVKIIEHVDETYESIKNLNSIKMEEE